MFQQFSQAVHAQFEAMSKQELFVVDIDGDALYDAYQAAFPAGTNEIFRKQREHECSCCKNFIRNIGNVVSIQNGELITVWDDLSNLPQPYQQVSETLARMVERAKIVGVFRAEQPKYGAQTTIEPASEENGGHQITWNHFHGKVSSTHYAGDKAAARIGEAAGIAQVLGRGLRELVPDDLDTVIELVGAKSLYRGAEKLHLLTGFRQLMTQFRSLNSEHEQELFIWANIGHPAARIRSDVIGTLLVDLAEGKPLEVAVKSYEDKVSGTNYQRPTALITPRMVEEAMRVVEAEGLESSLHRRMARIDDVSVNDILFVDNAVRGRMKGGLQDLLMDAAVSPTSGRISANASDITADDFIATVLPKARTVEVLVRGTQQGNFVTLTAPVYPDAAPLFKWDNGFAWSYDGNVADSIKERVKAKGGRTDAVLRVSLAWANSDDLDLHVIEPDGHEIYFGNKGRASTNTGMLDVDMNMGSSGSTFSATDPVENVTWSRPMDGKYRVFVHNYNQRTTSNPGFTLEIESAGQLHQFSCPTSPRSGAAIEAMTVQVIAGKVAAVDTRLVGAALSQEKWGVKTEHFTRATTVMLSPNHWGDQAVGAKHLIFALDGCKNPVPTRGFYNEFLRPGLEKHRKVFETLGSRLMCESTNDQLSGVGFSAARGDAVTVKVDGRTYNVKF